MTDCLVHNAKSIHYIQVALSGAFKLLYRIAFLQLSVPAGFAHGLEIRPHLLAKLRLLRAIFSTSSNTFLEPDSKGQKFGLSSSLNN